jgi:hypothetical protein
MKNKAVALCGIILVNGIAVAYKHTSLTKILNNYPLLCLTTIFLQYKSLTLASLM